MFTTDLVNLCKRNIFITSLYIYVFQDEKCRLMRSLSLSMMQTDRKAIYIYIAFLSVCIQQMSKRLNESSSNFYCNLTWLQWMCIIAPKKCHKIFKEQQLKAKIKNVRETLWISRLGFRVQAQTTKCVNYTLKLFNHHAL